MAKAFEDNRWVQLRKMIDWQMIDEEYSRHFKNKCAGQEASLVYSFFEVVFSFALSIRKQHKNNVISGAWTAV